MAVSDGGLTTTQAMTVTLVNVAPTITSAATVAMAENSLLATTVSATDPAGGTLVYALPAAPTPICSRSIPRRAR